MSKAKGAEFADALMSLQTSLTSMGMEEKWAEVEAKIGSKLRNTFMRKVPQTITTKLKESKGIDVSVTTDPLPEADAPAILLPEPTWDIVYRVEVPKRDAVVSKVAGLKAAVVRKMPQKAFLNIVQTQIEKKISEGVQQKLGQGLQLIVTTESDDDTGSRSKTDSFWLTVQVAGRSLRDVLSHAKGEEFAQSFEGLLTALHTMSKGMDSMKIIHDNIMTTVDGKILHGLATTLKGRLVTELGATLQQVSLESKDQLQSQASGGRCCSANGQMFWVDAQLARGAGALGLGFGRSGHCPRVVPHSNCVARGIGQDESAVKTEYATYTECFRLEEPMQLTAYPVTEVC